MRRFLFAATLFALIGMTVGTMIVIGFGGIPLLAGAVPPQPVVAPANSGPKIAVFNIAVVMKNFAKAKRQNDLLNEERKKLTTELIALQAVYLKNLKELRKCDEFKPREENPRKQDALLRQIEDKDRELNKLNEKASAINSAAYDDIKMVVDKTAEMNGYDIVFAYADEASPEEAKSAHMKELKLKPLAAQPFFVAKRVDMTGVVIQTLNTWEAYSPPPIP